MNKRGDEGLLPEELVRLVLAVICILALVALLVALYFTITGNQNKKYAEDSMKDEQGGLAAEIIRINNAGAPKEQGQPVPNPSGWYIFSFVGGELKPNLCTGNNCVCICESVRANIFDWKKRQVNKCDDKGSCTLVSNLKKFDKIKIERGGTALLIRKINSEIEITRK